MLKVIDKTNYGKLKGKKLSTVYRHTKSEWRCTTARGYFVYVKYKAGILAVAVAQREYDIADKVTLVGSTVDLNDQASFEEDSSSGLFPKITYPHLDFDEIAEFLKWKCDEEQIWDGYY